MTDLTFTYNESEFGWVSDSVELSFDIYLMVELSEAGYVVVKQQDVVTEEWVKVLVSERCDEAKVRIFVDDETEAKNIKVYTSVEPKNIRYVGI